MSIIHYDLILLHFSNATKSAPIVAITLLRSDVQVGTISFSK